MGHKRRQMIFTERHSAIWRARRALQGHLDAAAEGAVNWPKMDVIGWILYFLEVIEDAAQWSKGQYQDALREVIASIETRLQNGRW